MNKYLSVITNFGCHYKCPYCIVKNNNLQIPKSTIEGLDCLMEKVRENHCDIISLSGGGDPLHEYEKHIDWYRNFFSIVHKCNVYFNNKQRQVPVEMHTSYMTDETTFPFYDCYRVVYHANSYEQLFHIKRTGREIVRVVFVVTENYTVKDIMDIALFIKNSSDIDELSFRQIVGDNYEEKHYLEDYLRMGHQKLWWYIEQCDYNLYYCENKVYTEYKRIGEEKYSL